MQLQDIENECLMVLQQPQANAGGAPAWGAYTNAPFNQASVDYAINRGYLRLDSDLGDLELVSYTTSFPSSLNTSAYNIPPLVPAISTMIGTAVASTGVNTTVTPVSMSGIVIGQGLIIDNGLVTQETIYPTAATGTTFTATFYYLHTSTATVKAIAAPSIRVVQRVYYSPLGQSYTREQVPGVSLIPWQDFQRYVGSGYYRQNAFGTEPMACSITPDRKQLVFYPGASAVGDTISIVYQPIPTANSAVPLLVNETDVPFGLPDDTHQAIVYWALTILWAKAREFGAVGEYKQLYDLEVQRIKTNYMRRSAGDSMRFTDRGELYNGPYGALAYD